MDLKPRSLIVVLAAAWVREFNFSNRWNHNRGRGGYASTVHADFPAVV